jgi:hypothetical protein
MLHLDKPCTILILDENAHSGIPDRQSVPNLLQAKLLIQMLPKGSTCWIEQRYDRYVQVVRCTSEFLSSIGDK